MVSSPGDTRTAAAGLPVATVLDPPPALTLAPVDLRDGAPLLVCLDADSTFLVGEVIEMLAARAGADDEVVAITEAAMRGELDFAASLHARVALLSGLPASVIDDVAAGLVLSPGAEILVRTLHARGHHVGLVSGGFSQVLATLVHRVGIRHLAANTLEVRDDRLTGRVVPPVVDRAGKADALRTFAVRTGIPMARTVAIGDGANDLDMIEAARFGVAYRARPVLRAAVDACIDSPDGLDTVLTMLGLDHDHADPAG